MLTSRLLAQHQLSQHPVSQHPVSQLPWLQHGFGTRGDKWSAASAAHVKQIHSGTVLSVTRPGVAGEGDALVTATPRLAISVRTADCYPVLLADHQKRIVAAIHAGWRGTAARIVHAAIEKMGSDPADLVAAIGPGIGACCYEVGPDVASQFHRSHVHGSHLDLAAANRQQLIESGVDPKHISVSGLCTYCEAEQFYSFRREKALAGRMISFIQIL